MVDDRATIKEALGSHLGFAPGGWMSPERAQGRETQTSRASSDPNRRGMTSVMQSSEAKAGDFGR